MWILNWLPNWIFYAIVLIGLIAFSATYLLKYIPIPMVFMYRKPIQAASIVAIIFGTFMSGAIYNNNVWINRVKEMEAKVAKAEEESKSANEKIDSKVKEATQKIKEKQVLVKQYIDREIVKYDNTCVIPKEFIEVHNKAATK
jgi:hypothetical protein